jgi:2-haloacid dehalogenase
MSSIQHFVFDAYGTLFDVHSAASQHAVQIGPHWERLSQIWRTKHLEYTWTHATTGRHTTFWTLARRSLDFAAASTGGLSDELKVKLMGAYRTLGAYPEVRRVLAELKAKGARLAILTNGDPDMIADAVQAANLNGLFDAVLTVHEVGVFKPNLAVYGLATSRFGVQPSAISFQSSNRWDAAAAHVFGMKTVWINRVGAADEYPDMPADHVVSTLDHLPTLYS